MNMGSIVVSAATLSFLGLGAPEGYADWGQMISFPETGCWALLVIRYSIGIRLSSGLAIVLLSCLGTSLVTHSEILWT